ncbi:hypothetical protein Pa4123_74870 [Phytohabitans aurantiacus]|uniref:TraB/GumN family protein n=1 Tax=Phytohabitans aurantiacus TaxID=3016789 RepID=A0ABQ5R601_9ACTN|nr:hypothetical protein Pa4123_74870 [Phytohabitans aurantiacus]
MAAGILAGLLATVAVPVTAAGADPTSPVALPAPSGPYPVGMSRLHPSWDTAWQGLSGWRRWFTVTGTVHMSFSDYAPLAKRFGLPLAALDGDRTDEIVRVYVAAFFDTHLRGAARPVLDGADPDYPEVTRFP